MNENKYPLLNELSDMEAKMKGNIYRQQYNDTYHTNIEVDIKDGRYQQCVCKECNGTGAFYITDDDFQKCVECRGTGKLWFNVY